MDAEQLTAAATAMRRTCVELAARTRSSHIGGVLSMLDLLTYLYEVRLRRGDRFVLSKGHAALGLYAALHQRGVLTDEDLDGYYRDGSRLLGHASHMVSGVDVSTGSLGHGPAIAAGVAWGFKRQGAPRRVYCLMGDGECQEGTVWEALLLVARLGLGNLTLIIDANGYQGFSDPTAELLPPDRLRDMLRATGLDVVETDGHNFEAIHAACEPPSAGARVVLARTVKGRGVSFMENNFEWHYKSPDADQLRQALDELR